MTLRSCGRHEHACLLFEIVSGRRAFTGNSAIAVLSAIVNDEPARLSELVRRMPKEIEPLIAHCLEKKPQDRFQSARDLAFAMQAIVAGPGARDVHRRAAVRQRQRGSERRVPE